MPRKKHSAEFKAKVALEAFKGQKTLTELSSEYGVHANQITRWKKQLQEGIKEIFSTNSSSKSSSKDEKLQAKLYQEIGRLKVELDWLKKRI